MGFIEREIERINSELRKGQGAPNFDQLYAAQQALSWAFWEAQIRPRPPCPPSEGFL